MPSYHSAVAPSAVLLACLVVLSCEPAPGPSDTSMGVSQALASQRDSTLAEVSYSVRLRIPEARSEPLTGTTAISFRWDDPAGRDVVVDFKDPDPRVHAVRANGHDAPWRAEQDHVVVPAASLAPGGDNVVEIDYDAGDDALNRSDDFLYTLFVPDRAHFSMPVFDQPNLKARLTLELTVPEGWSAVANGPEVGQGETAADGATVHRYRETRPLPTYLFAFAAGRFQVEEAERSGRTLRMYHRETDRDKVARNREAVFDLVDRALGFMEDYTGIPFPFAKYEFALIPPFQYSGMEHPGAVFYRQSSILLDESATQGQILGRASLIAHETAHQWFGDLVTMDWFDDVWMKEVFANFMAAKIVHPSFPEVDHDLRFLLAHHPTAYAVDRTPGTNPIRQPLDNLREAGSLYGPIIYQKAPIVMRQLEARVGEDTFRDGVREYLRRFAYRNATWPDLIGILDQRVPEDLAAWSHVWVEEPGRPTVRVQLDEDGGTVRALRIRQEDPWGLGRVWPQTLHLVAAYGDSLVRDTVELDGPELELAEWAGRPAPDWILPNGGGLEYGLFVPDTASLLALEGSVGSLRPDLIRGSAWLTMQDALLEGRVPPERMLDLALADLEHENDEQLTQYLLGMVRQVYWRLLSDSTRRTRAPGVEAALWSGVERAPSSSLRAAWFGAYRSMALTEPAVARLRRIWRGDETVPGLTLAESDRTELASELALRQVPDAEAILDAQAAGIENPDRRARFDFVRPSLSADPAVRESFFESLRDPANREREPWVLDGLANLNHPLRREHAQRLVEPALELVEEIQRTGDIFFPGRWLDATLDGHNRPGVVRTVAAFLEARPDYPFRLRGKILQSADGVERAARIVYGDSVPSLASLRTPVEGEGGG